MANKVNSRICLVMSILLLLTLSASIMGKTIYVDDDAVGANDGTSWDNAYVYLQDALADANLSEKPVEILVAKGIYKPDRGANQTLGDREATFKLINAVTLKGGYAGNGASDPNTRNVDLYETILSGDLLNNDGNANDLKELLFEFYDENSFSVVTGSGTDDSAVLDGFTITAGNANVPYWNDPYPDADHTTTGAGMYNQSGHSTVIHCTFIRNSAEYGGGMCNRYGNPALTNCTFTANFAWLEGAGMSNEASNPMLDHCTFDKNSSLLHVSLLRYVDSGLSNDASNPMLFSYLFDRIGPHLSGGGMHNNQSNPILTNCIFSENQAGSGGGIDNSESNPKLTSCIFIGNSVSYDGGGIDNWFSNPMILDCTFSSNSSGSTGAGIGNYESRPTLTNCTFTGNRAYYRGGGMYNDGRSDATLTGCIFVGNSSDWRGGGMAGSRSSNATLINCTITGNAASEISGIYNYESSTIMTNSILWGNSITQRGNNAQITGDVTISYSNIQGGWEGEGNIDLEPFFADPSY